MRLPRMTTRRWMIVVVAVGMVMGGTMGGIRLKRRHDFFLSQAWYFSAMESACQKQKDAFVSAIKYHSLHGGTEQERRSLLKDLAREDHVIPYYATMARKYRQATRYPWLSVEPDPPPP